MEAISVGIDMTSDDDVQLSSLMALAEVPTIGYHYILDYLPKIGGLTHNFLQV